MKTLIKLFLILSVLSLTNSCNDLSYDPIFPDRGVGSSAGTEAPKMGKMFVEQSGPSTAKVTWQAATDDMTTPEQMGYEIHVSETANFTPSDATRRTQVFGVTEAEISSLETGKTYYVLVVAVDKQGAGSGERQYVTVSLVNATKAPRFSGILSVVPMDSSSFSILWGAATDPLTESSQIKYEVHVSSESNFKPTKETLRSAVTGRTYTEVHNLTSGTYNVLVVARNQYGLSSVEIDYKKITLPSDLRPYDKAASFARVRDKNSPIGLVVADRNKQNFMIIEGGKNSAGDLETPNKFTLVSSQNPESNYISVDMKNTQKIRFDLPQNYSILLENYSSQTKTGDLTLLRRGEQSSSLCKIFSSTNIPLDIPEANTTITNSNLSISGAGTIGDINVLNLKGTHTRMGDLQFNLKSPWGENILLFGPECGEDDNFDINFDDDSTVSSIACPPTNHARYKPKKPLSTFAGKSADGVWTLNIQDNVSSNTGKLTEWALEICPLGSIGGTGTDTVLQTQKQVSLPNLSSNFLDLRMKQKEMGFNILCNGGKECTLPYGTQGTLTIEYWNVGADAHVEMMAGNIYPFFGYSDTFPSGAGKVDYPITPYAIFSCYDSDNEIQVTISSGGLGFDFFAISELTKFARESLGIIFSSACKAIQLDMPRNIAGQAAGTVTGICPVAGLFNVPDSMDDTSCPIDTIDALSNIPDLVACKNNLFSFACIDTMYGLSSLAESKFPCRSGANPQQSSADNASSTQNTRRSLCKGWICDDTAPKMKILGRPDGWVPCGFRLEGIKAR